MCLTLYLILLTILVLYVLLVIIFITGWNSIPQNIKSENINKIKTSVIVACKNEELNLGKLINALKKQSESDFELIFVNDHSTDSTGQILISASNDFQNFRIVDSVGFGKKNALKEGISKASGELIITTDADCVPANTWIESIINSYSNTYNDLIIGPVVIKSEKSLFSKLQKIEFASLVASGAGAAGVGMPIMCNGANLAFTKAAWLESSKDLHEDEISGDDVFLLLSIKKRKGKIGFLKSSEAMVITNSVDNLTDFTNQRKRWASKSKKYTDKHIIISALIVFVICVIEILIFALSFLDYQYFKLFFIVFGIKFLADYIFLDKISGFFILENFRKDAFILSVVYPFYIVYTAASGIFEQNIKWK